MKLFVLCLAAAVLGVASAFPDRSSGNVALGVDSSLGESCPEGSIYDSELGECVKMETFAPVGKCPPTDTDPPVYLADDKDPAVFYQCGNGIPYPQRCPDGTIWDQSKRTCVKRENKPNVDHVPDEHDEELSKYLRDIRELVYKKIEKLISLH